MPAVLEKKKSQSTRTVWRVPVHPSALAVGFVPLVDCAPLVAAAEWGHFKKEGLEVKLTREIGWASIRERLVYNEVHACHAPLPMAASIHLGLSGGTRANVLTAFVMSLQGNAITLSAELRAKGVRDAVSLGRLMRSERPRRMTFGVVSQHSMHNLLLRKWLRLGGIDPDSDVRLVVLPPRQMCRSISTGSIDGYCAGEPWNTIAVTESRAWCPALSSELYPLHPEKILLVRESFAEEREEEHHAMIRALSAASRECDRPERRRDLVKLLARPEYLGIPEAAIAASLLGPFRRGDGTESGVESFHVFHRSEANVPSEGMGLRLLQEMNNERLLPRSMESAESLVRVLFREDIHRKALARARNNASPSSKN